LYVFGHPFRAIFFVAMTSTTSLTRNAQEAAKDESIPREWWTDADVSRIASCEAALEGSDPAIKWLKWLPRYGSIIVAHAFPGQIPGTVALSVLGLDPHSLSLHAQRPGESGVYDYLGRASDYVELSVGLVLEKSLQEITKRFEQGLADAQKEIGERRSAGHNAQGHQLTPSMIQAILLDAAAPTGTKHKPAGGFTDCGIHTGGRPRNTSFPLARSFFHWVLKRTDDAKRSTYLKVMLFFDLDTVDNGLSELGAAMPGRVGWDGGSHGLRRQELDSAVAILADACLKCPKLSSLNVDLRCMLDRAIKLKSTIDSLQAQLQVDEVKRFTFGDIQSELSAPKAYRNPTLSLDPKSLWNVPVKTQDNAYALTKSNIGLIHLFEPDQDFDWPSLLEWVEALEADAMSNNATAWLLIR
jgi:hypothetical protein